MQVGLFLISSKNAFQGHQQDAARAVTEALGAALEVFWAEGESHVQREQMFTFVRRRPAPTGVVVAPVEDGGLRFVAQEATRNGVAWVMLNRTPAWLEELARDSKSLAFAVSADQDGIGRIQGDQYRALLPRGGTVLAVTGPLKSEATRQRTATMEEAKGSLISIVRVFGNWAEESGYSAVKGWLETTRGLVPFDLIGAQNDDMAVGGLRAVAELAPILGKPELRAIAACGADGVPNFGQRWVQEKKLAATVTVPATAGKAIEMLAALERGETPALVTRLPVAPYPSMSDLRPLR